ncbi:hypothetical protein [Sphingomonas hengshuiensis]|uniref:Uncharacterized protein n=1 Tax=Sphingomonas hengshuiensis TaxID=1609977 RepID=A0A7U4J700_9SPHN|nr:hypothetical protein [Sphingomonas hengshuiensis]AJP71406.1 hypothetical protein TS85_05915 [Sphingomonas hengshuiensis]
MHILPIAALALAATALPAHAADLATLDCVVSKLDAAARSQIEADVVRNMAETGKRPTYAPAVKTALKEAATACATEHQWSNPAAGAAAIYALAKVGLPIAQRVVGERGFDAAALEDQFQALPEETRNRVLTAEENQALVRGAVTEEAQQTRENAELLNEYFAFLSTVQYAAQEFSQG